MPVETSLGVVSGGTIGATSPTATDQKTSAPKPQILPSSPTSNLTRVNVPGIGPVAFSQKADIPKVVSNITSSPNFLTPSQTMSVQNLLESYKTAPQTFSPGAKQMAEQYKTQGFVATSEVPYAQYISSLGGRITPPQPQPLATGPLMATGLTASALAPTVTKAPMPSPVSPDLLGITTGGLVKPPTGFLAGGGYVNPFTQQTVAKKTQTEVLPAGGITLTGTTTAKPTFSITGTTTATGVIDKFSSDVGKRLEAGFGQIAGTPTTTTPSAPIITPGEVKAGGKEFLGNVQEKVGLGIISATGTLGPATGTLIPGKPAATGPIRIPAPGETGFLEAPGGKTFQKIDVGGTTKYVPVPSTEEFLSASLKTQPFATFKSDVLKTAGESYDTQAQQIIAAGGTPSITKSEYLSNVEKTVTPQLQQSLILQQYPEQIQKYTVSNISKLPQLSAADITAQRDLEAQTSFFRTELAKGKVPLGLEALTATNLGVLAPAVAGGAAKALGFTSAGEESLAASREAEANLLARASIAGRTPGGTLGFEVGQIGETATGVAAESIALGVGAGAITRAVLPAITSTTTGAGLAGKALLVSAQHPTLIKYGLGIGLPAGIEAAQIGGRALSGAPLSVQAKQTATELTELGGFGYGFAKTLQYGTGLKYETQEIPLGKTITEKLPGGGVSKIEPGALQVSKTFGFEYQGEGALGGPPNIFASKELYPAPTSFHLGGPSFTEAPPLSTFKGPSLVSSATSAEVMQKLFSAPGGGPGSEALVERMGAVEKFFPTLYQAKAPVSPKEFKLESSSLSETQNKALTDVVANYKEKYVEVYGSQAQKMQLTPETQRDVADVDILSKLSQKDTESLARQISGDLQSKGIRAQVDPNTPTLIVNAKTGQHLVDLHSIEEPEPAQSFAYGFSLQPDTFKISGVPTSRLYKEGFRKLASVGTIQPTEDIMSEIKSLSPTQRMGLSPTEYFQAFYGTSPSAGAVVGPEAHRAAKDISDVTRIAENLELGTPAKAPSISAAESSYLSAYGMAAVPTVPGPGLPGEMLLFKDVPSIASSIGKGFGSTAVGVPTSTAGYGPSATTTVPSIKSVSPPSPMNLPLIAASPTSIPAAPSEVSSVFPSIRSLISSSPSISAVASPSVSISPSSITSPSISASISPPPSVPVSPSVSASPSISPSISPSLSASLSPSLSPSPSISPSMLPLFSLQSPFGSPPSMREEKRGGLRLAPSRRPSKPGREKAGYGILSEGLSKELFGKATISPTAKTTGRAIYSPTSELEKAGISFPKFLESGGYVGMSMGNVKLGKGGKGLNIGKNLLGGIKGKITDIRTRYAGSPRLTSKLK